MFVQLCVICWGYVVFVVLVIGFIILFLVFIVWMSFFFNKILFFLLQGYMLDWYLCVWELLDFCNGFFFSIWISLIVIGIVLVLGLLVSFVLVWICFKGCEVINMVLMLLMIVFGIVGGSVLFVFFLEVEFLIGWCIVGISVGLLVVYGLIVLFWMIRLVIIVLILVNFFVEEVVCSLGVGLLMVFWCIILLVIKLGVIVGLLFVFINFFIDLEKLLFLVGFNSMILQIVLINYLEWNFDLIIGVVVIVQIVLVMVLLIVIDCYVKFSCVF